VDREPAFVVPSDSGGGVDAAGLPRKGLAAMRSVQPGMNVARQRRKITQLLDETTAAGDVDGGYYIAYLLGLFDANVALRVPRPASEFLVMYAEEFGEQGR
jgi:hypothetical protein